MLKYNVHDPALLPVLMAAVKTHTLNTVFQVPVIIF